MHEARFSIHHKHNRESGKPKQERQISIYCSFKGILFIMRHASLLASIICTITSPEELRTEDINLWLLSPLTKLRPENRRISRYCPFNGKNLLNMCQIISLAFTIGAIKSPWEPRTLEDKNLGLLSL